MIADVGVGAGVGHQRRAGIPDFSLHAPPPASASASAVSTAHGTHALVYTELDRRTQQVDALTAELADVRREWADERTRRERLVMAEAERCDRVEGELRRALTLNAHLAAHASRAAQQRQSLAYIVYLQRYFRRLMLHAVARTAARRHAPPASSATFSRRTSTGPGAAAGAGTVTRGGRPHQHHQHQHQHQHQQQQQPPPAAPAERRRSFSSSATSHASHGDFASSNSSSRPTSRHAATADDSGRSGSGSGSGGGSGAVVGGPAAGSGGCPPLPPLASGGGCASRKSSPYPHHSLHADLSAFCSAAWESATASEDFDDGDGGRRPDAYGASQSPAASPEFNQPPPPPTSRSMPPQPRPEQLPPAYQDTRRSVSGGSCASSGGGGIRKSRSASALSGMGGEYSWHH